MREQHLLSGQGLYKVASLIPMIAIFCSNALRHGARRCGMVLHGGA